MGSRTCVGRNISLLEMSKLVPQLIREFDIDLEQPGEKWQTVNTWFVKQKNIGCRIKRKQLIEK